MKTKKPARQYHLVFYRRGPEAIVGPMHWFGRACAFHPRELYSGCKIAKNAGAAIEISAYAYSQWSDWVTFDDGNELGGGFHTALLPLKVRRR